MKVKSLPIKQTFDLTSDPEGIAKVTIRQAREDENIARQDMFSKITRVFDGEGVDGSSQKVRVEVESNDLRLRRRECYLVLENVEGVFGSDAKELFRSANSGNGELVRNAMTETEFSMSWNQLDEEAREEIYGYVMEVNPTWDQHSSKK